MTIAILEMEFTKVSCIPCSWQSDSFHVLQDVGIIPSGFYQSILYFLISLFRLSKSSVAWPKFLWESQYLFGSRRYFLHRSVLPSLLEFLGVYTSYISYRYGRYHSCCLLLPLRANLQFWPNWGLLLANGAWYYLVRSSCLPPPMTNFPPFFLFLHFLPVVLGSGWPCVTFLLHLPTIFLQNCEINLHPRADK